MTFDLYIKITPGVISLGVLLEGNTNTATFRVISRTEKNHISGVQIGWCSLYLHWHLYPEINYFDLEAKQTAAYTDIVCSSWFYHISSIDAHLTYTNRLQVFYNGVFKLSDVRLSTCSQLGGPNNEYSKITSYIIMHKNSLYSSHISFHSIFYTLPV